MRGAAGARRAAGRVRRGKGAAVPSPRTPGSLGRWVQARCSGAAGTEGWGGRKPKAICGNKPEMQGREGRTVAAEGHKHLQQYLASSRRPEPYGITDPGWPDISVRGRALIRCGKCSVTAPERVYVQNRCLLAGAVARRHFINYISLALL